ncbi:hypothetical protein [Candidatus Tisiphia endosymbiont of Hybos culiciformis]|uniref:hypothetical protein n=1 Tax=Candidatus Tisiphia endosymbiont of Hybos culiciformis TaxID=3139331 RepID=UPI003CCA7DCF
MTIFAKLKEKIPFLTRNNKSPEGKHPKYSSEELLDGKVDLTTNEHQQQILNSKPDINYSHTEEIIANPAIRYKQYNLLLLIFGSSIIAVLVLISLMQGKNKQKAIINDNDNPKPKLEVASEALDPEKMWRNHFEDLLNDNKRKFDERLQGAETNFIEKEQKLQEEIKLELAKMHVQLNFAKSELISATEELKRMQQIHQEAEQNVKDLTNDANISAVDLNSQIEFDKPKDAKIYIPETSYVSGYLLGGLAVSTALNTPDENASPVVIRLTERGNLPKNFNLDISTCRILGSSYGDL